MRLLHYSNTRIGELRSVDQIDDLLPYTKPRGFWVSVEGEDDWRSWCLAESFGLERLTHVHEVKMADNVNVLRLSSAVEIDAFTAQFGERDGCWTAIKWHNVAAQYQGIIIAPYVWSRRLGGGANWYYGWDCASGCIWDADAVRSVTLVDIAPVPEPAD